VGNQFGVFGFSAWSPLGPDGRDAVRVEEGPGRLRSSSQHCWLVNDRFWSHDRS
jgi:hypothetical protein